jgi:hypothetical protein
MARFLFLFVFFLFFVVNPDCSVPSDHGHQGRSVSQAKLLPSPRSRVGLVCRTGQRMKEEMDLDFGPHRGGPNRPLKCLICGRKSLADKQLWNCTPGPRNDPISSAVAAFKVGRFGSTRKRPWPPSEHGSLTTNSPRSGSSTGAKRQKAYRKTGAESESAPASAGNGQAAKYVDYNRFNRSNRRKRPQERFVAQSFRRPFYPPDSRQIIIASQPRRRWAFSSHL